MSTAEGSDRLLARRNPSFLTDFLSESHVISERLGGFVWQLEPALQEVATRYVAKAGLGSDAMAWPSIYFLLPFWIERDLGAERTSAVSDIAYANACLTYTVLLQDEAMDEDLRDDAAHIAAASAFLMEGFIAYSSWFPHNSSFWGKAGRLMRESWNALLIERTTHVGGDSKALEGDEEIQQQKVNWLKAAAIGTCDVLGRADVSRDMLAYLDHWQTACQLMDDLVDAEADLNHGNYTRLLVTAGARPGLSDNKQRVERFIGSERLHQYLDVVDKNYGAALAACSTRDGYLARHIDYLRERVSAFRGLQMLTMQWLRVDTYE